MHGLEDMGRIPIYTIHPGPVPSAFVCLCHFSGEYVLWRENYYVPSYLQVVFAGISAILVKVYAP